MDFAWPWMASRLPLAGGSLLIRRSNLLAILLMLLVVLIGLDSFSSANSKQLAYGRTLHSSGRKLFVKIRGHAAEREKPTTAEMDNNNNRIELGEEDLRKPSRSRHEQHQQVPEQTPIVVSSSDISYVSASPIQATTETSSAIIRPSAKRNSFKHHISSSSSIISNNYINNEPSSDEIESRYKPTRYNRAGKRLLAGNSGVSTTATTTQRNKHLYAHQQNLVRVLPADPVIVIDDDEEEDNAAAAPSAADDDDDEDDEEDDDLDDDLDDDIDDGYESNLVVKWPWRLSTTTTTTTTTTTPSPSKVWSGARDLYTLLGEQGQANNEANGDDINNNEHDQLVSSSPTTSLVYPASSGLPHYSKIINGHHSLSHQRQWRDSHIASIRIGQDDQYDYGRGGLNSAIIAIMFGIGATGMLIVIVGYKMKSIRQRLAYKGRRRSLVPDADFLINTIPI